MTVLFGSARLDIEPSNEAAELVSLRRDPAKSRLAKRLARCRDVSALASDHGRGAPLRPRTGWRTVFLTQQRVTLHRGIASLAYRVFAEKSDVPLYEAFCASTYLKDDGKWQRLSHQEAPTANSGV
jgi:hypothetical protein